jgi:Mn-containing catalase
VYYHDRNLQYTVRVDTPNPLFAKMLQQAIGGVEGEIRVMLQYLFQAWGARGPAKYRDMLLQTGTEEIGHIEMLATAVAMNLEGAPVEFKDEAAKNPVVAAVLGGMNPRHFLSTGHAATPEADTPDARWLQGRSIDGKGDFQYLRDFQPVGQEPKLGAPDPRGHAQKEQMEAEGLLEKAKKIL